MRARLATDSSSGAIEFFAERFYNSIREPGLYILNRIRFAISSCATFADRRLMKEKHLLFVKRLLCESARTMKKIVIVVAV